MKPAIRAQNLAKRYHLRTGPRGGANLTEMLVGAARSAWDRLRGRSATNDRDEFWALQDVSFEVGRGEVVGIIGRNGAGKSTLLKILSRITEPTAGRVEVRGRMGSLLEVGTGFHPELTGRENVFLNGSLLGMPRGQIHKKFDEIAAFAGVERFLDTPVKRYSSGMYVRLAFAVAAHLEPEILVIDEVLAVGDQEFQQKCIGKMRDVAGQGRTVLFVSHNMPVVQKLCSRAVLLVSGRVRTIGPVAAVVDEYLATQTGDVLALGRSLDLRTSPRWGGSGEARFAEVTTYDPADHSATGGFRGGDIGFRMRLTGQLDAVRAVGLSITDESDRKLINANTLEKVDRVEIGPGGTVELEVFGVNLRPGRYKVGFWVGAGETRHVDVVTEAAILEVLPPVGSAWASPHDGVFRCPFAFRVLSGEAT
jgi:lipopolysaccharide transport system ATP-binding protein